MKRHAWLIAILMLLALPAAAQSARGYASTDINLRAGPDIGYPVVDFIPAGVRLYVHGCTFDWSWCDVSVFGERGWVGGDFIDYPYERRYVSVYDYGATIGIPIVSFVIGDYWHDHYRHRRFYRDRDYWYRHRDYHRVPRYRHDRPRLADTVRWNARNGNGYTPRYRYAEGRRDDDRRDRDRHRHDAGDRHWDGRGDGDARFGRRVDIRNGGHGYDRSRPRLAPGVRRADMPHNGGSRLAAPRQSPPGFNRPSGGNRMSTRSLPSRRSSGHGISGNATHRGGNDNRHHRDVRKPRDQR